MDALTSTAWLEIAYWGVPGAAAAAHRLPLKSNIRANVGGSKEIAWMGSTRFNKENSCSPPMAVLDKENKYVASSTCGRQFYAADAVVDSGGGCAICHAGCAKGYIAVRKIVDIIIFRNYEGAVRADSSQLGDSLESRS